MTATTAGLGIRKATALLRGAAESFDQLDVQTALELAPLFAEAERVALAATVRLARLVGDEAARRRAGTRDAATLLSSLAGSSVGRARASIEAAGHLESVPILAKAFSGGELSLDQALVVASAVAAEPREARSLLDAAHKLGMKELKREAERVKHRARGEAGQAELERRLHARRYCRTWAVEGGVRVDALLPASDGARFMAALEKHTRDLFQRSGTAVTEPHDRLRADALVDLVAGKRGRGGTVAVAEVIVRVDAAALRRGEVGDGEVCEIAGVGPVSVGHLRSMLGDAFVTMLVRDGADITTVTSTRRAVPRRIRMALYERDPHCVVPGCAATEGLEIDHWHTDFAGSGPTSLDNLCRLCTVHHRLKTRTNWRLLGGPGDWKWLPPRPLRRTPRAGP